MWAHYFQVEKISNNQTEHEITHLKSPPERKNIPKFQMSWVQFLKAIAYALARVLQLTGTGGQMKRPVSTQRSPAEHAVELTNSQSNRNCIHLSSGLPGSGVT